jgi:hypothetical protein
MDPGNSPREVTRQNRPLEPRLGVRSSGRYTNRNAYSRRLISGSSVNVVANPAGLLRYRRLSRMCPRISA